MKEIELSTMVLGSYLDLPGYEKKHVTQVTHDQYGWETAWNSVLQIGLYQKGPDVSEVGSTWLENLSDMRALRPFSVPELHSLGGEIAFLSNAWTQEATPPTVPVTNTGALTPRRVSSIPWILDTRLITYRRDLLAQAGIAEEGAFATPEAMYDTLCRLQDSGIRYPLGLATGGLSLHNLACFVWGRGGHFRSPDYHHIALVEPEARQGLVDFFRLHRFIDPTARDMDYTSTNVHFYQGSLPVMLNGQWAMHAIKECQPGIAPQVLENTGYAAPPGVPFVGAAHLVIWRHTFQEQEAIQLIGHLTSQPVLERIFHGSGNIPARLSALSQPPFSTDPDYQLVVSCLRSGRMFRSARLWAGVEMRLNTLFDQLWDSLFANPELDLEAEIEKRIRELAVRLEKTLLANW